MIHGRAFDIASLCVRVTSSDAATLDWLGEFLGPAFPPADAASVPHHAIAVEFNSIDYENCVRTAPEAAEEIDCFTLDQRYGRCRSWLDSARRRLIHDSNTGCLYIHDERDRHALTILTTNRATRSRLGLLRVVRELATAHALRLGYLHLHAAAVETGGRTVAFGGPRMSGKSTLLLHALASAEARFMTGDRLVVDTAGGRSIAHAMPTIVTLRQEALDAFPLLRSRLEASGYEWSLTKAESSNRGGPHERRASEEPARSLPAVSPSQLCDLMRVPATGAGSLGLMAFPRITSDESVGGVRALSAEEAAGRIRSSLFLASVPERIPAAFDGDVPPFVRDAAALDALAVALAGQVRCVEVSLGRRGPVWDQIVEHLQ